jgi:RNA methyltransferase, TrmH family
VNADGGGEVSKSRTSPGEGLSKREEKLVRALRRRKDREASGRFLAEGIRSVEDLLTSELSVQLAVTASPVEDTPRGRELVRAIRERGIPHRRMEPAELSELAGTEAPQGVLAVGVVPAWSLDEVLATPGRRVVLVLDAVQDPGNLGTLARTAEALGAAGVLVLPGSVDPWNAKAVRAAMGATFRIPVIPVGRDEALDALRRHGYRVLASAVDGAPLGRCPERAALVVGNEGAGVSVPTRREADAVVGIPLRGRAESLNVAAAAAILLHELLR